MHPASANRLLFDLLTMPAAMRIERLLPLARELHAGGRSLDLAAVKAGMASEDKKKWPWEEPLYTVEQGVATVTFVGPMVKGYDDVTCWCWGMASIDRLQQTMVELTDRTDVRSVVLNIDSGGGMVMGTPELGDAISALNERKPVFAFTSGMMCSAAYWSGCAAGQVYSTRSAMVGSIGVYLAVYDYSKMFEQIGIGVELFKQGTFKGMFVEGTSLSEEQRKWITDSVKRDYDDFTAHVREHRGEIADSTMQGQWFTGEQAVSLGLVDRVVTGLPEVVALARALNQSPLFASR